MRNLSSPYFCYAAAVNYSKYIAVSLLLPLALLSSGCGHGAGGMGGSMEAPQAPSQPLLPTPQLSTVAQAMAEVTETGTVHAVDLYGSGASHAMVQVYPGDPYSSIDCYNSNAPHFHVGDRVVCVGTYAGSGSSHWIQASSLTLATSASPTPQASSSTSTRHVLTADYAGGSSGTHASVSSIAPWLSWAETTMQENPALRGAGVKAMYYTDPNRLQPSDYMWTSNESAFAHTCSGSRIKSTVYADQYLMNPASSSLRQDWDDYISSRSQGVTWDAIFEDNANNISYTTATPCGYNASTWLASSVAENSFQVPVPIIYNGLVISNQMGLNASPNVLGGMYEGCYSDATSRPKIWTPYWTDIENAEITMARSGKQFICLGRDSSSASSATDGRLYTYASFLLTYTPSSSILWDNYDTSSGFHVEPETKLVALQPLVSTPSTVDGLRLSTGVYGREFGACYIDGSSVGACAVVVNPDRSSSHGYPYGSKYAHTLRLSGSGIIDGGSISTSGSRPPSSVPALGSYIVFK